MNTPFLQQVARYYLEVNNLEDYCFVFPNRRSGQFFVHYLSQQLIDVDRAASRVKPHLLPCVTSVNELVAQLTGTTTATDIEMIFALYDAYCQVFGDKAQEFDKFVYWAQLIIGDFNDIDKSLNDASEIFKNLDDLHSLSSNYLTPEVLEQVRAIFGESLFTSFFDTGADADLWQRRSHGEQPEGSVKQEFQRSVGCGHVLLIISMYSGSTSTAAAIRLGISTSTFLFLAPRRLRICPVNPFMGPPIILTILPIMAGESSCGEIKVCE